MKPTPKPPLFSRGYKIFAIIILLALLTAFALPKVRYWLASEVYIPQNEQHR